MSDSSKTSAWDKFLLLSWKNWVVQIRHPVQTTFEFIVPIFVCALMIFVRCKAKVTEHPEPTIYHPEEISDINATIFGSKLANPFIFHSPNNEILNELVRKVAETLNLEHNKTYAMTNSSDLEDASRRLNPFASIEFDDDLKVSSP